MAILDDLLEALSANVSGRIAMLGEIMNETTDPYLAEMDNVSQGWSTITVGYSQIEDDSSDLATNIAQSLQLLPQQFSQKLDSERVWRAAAVESLLMSQHGVAATQASDLQKLSADAKTRKNQSVVDLERILNASVSGAALQLAQIRDVDSRVEKLTVELEDANKWKVDFVDSERNWRNLVADGFAQMKHDFNVTTKDMDRLNNLVDKEILDNVVLAEHDADSASDTVRNDEDETLGHIPAAIGTEVNAATTAQHNITSAELTKLGAISNELDSIDEGYIHQPDGLAVA